MPGFGLAFLGHQVWGPWLSAAATRNEKGSFEQVLVLEDFCSLFEDIWIASCGV
jgi:hypothetical protein